MQGASGGCAWLSVGADYQVSRGLRAKLHHKPSTTELKVSRELSAT